MSSSSPPPSRAAIIPSLSGLRGVAALAVVYLHHNWDHGQKNMGGWDTWQEFGHIAVKFFFVLSAFLLTYRGLHDLKRESDVKYVTIAGRRIPILSLRWISYFIRRMFRIYPCYMLTVILAVYLPRFQGDEIQGPNAPYYFDFASNKGLGPSDVFNFVVLYNVRGVFWTIPPEIEYYIVIPIIVVLFELAQEMDMRRGDFIDQDAASDTDHLTPSNEPLSIQIAMALFKNLRRCVFRTIHLVFFSILALPGVLDTAGWYEKKFNQNHLSLHYFRFWTGSFVAIILYILERNGLVPKPISGETVNNATEKAQKFAKQILFVLFDLGCWGILVGTIFTFPWYQGHYFHRRIPKVDPATFPNPEYQVNTTHVFYHSNVYDSHWHERYTSTRTCAHICGLLIFMICYGARNGTFSRFFQWSFFMWCGEVSFPIYLLHVAGLREYTRLWMKYVSQTPPILLDNFFLGILASVFLASLMHYAVERPCMKAGSKLVRLLRSTVFKPPPKALPTSMEEKERLKQ